MSQKTKNLLHNLEKYLAILILIGGLSYLYFHIEEPQISTKSGIVFVLLELSCLEIWSSIKETTEKHKTRKDGSK